MNQLNKVELVGIVGSIAPQAFPGLARFSVATNYAYKAKDGSVVVETTWHNVVFWGDIQLQRGDSVRVEGRIRQHRYTASDGVERSAYEIVAKSVEKLDEPATTQMA